MTDKPAIDRKVGALDSCLIVNRVISFLCDHFEDVVGLADQYRTGIAGAMDFILESGLEEAFTARAVMQQAEKEEEILSSLGRSADGTSKPEACSLPLAIRPAGPADYERSEKDALWEGL